MENRGFALNQGVTITIQEQSGLLVTEKYWTECGVVSMDPYFKHQFTDFELFPTAKSALEMLQLNETLLCSEVMNRLGSCTIVTISELKSFLEQIKSSECFIFFVRGKDGMIWKVDAYLAENDEPNAGWSLFADPVAGNIHCEVGYNVVCRLIS